jgi:hypothetical protein
MDLNKLRLLEGSMPAVLWLSMSIPESLDELSMMTNVDDAVSLVVPLDGIATDDVDEAASEETVIANDAETSNNDYYNNGPELVQMTDADGRVWYTGEVETVGMPEQMTDADGRVWYTGEEAAASSSITLKLALISVAASSFVVALLVMPW